MNQPIIKQIIKHRIPNLRKPFRMCLKSSSAILSGYVEENSIFINILEDVCETHETHEHLYYMVLNEISEEVQKKNYNFELIITIQDPGGEDQEYRIWHLFQLTGEGIC